MCHAARRRGDDTGRRSKGTPMTQTPNPPAGWYPQGSQERWWDGTAWSDNFRPLGSEQATQFTQPVTVGYGQPAYGQPYLAGPARQSHTARNILIIFGVLFLVFVGGCFAVVVVITGRVND